MKPLLMSLLFATVVSTVGYSQGDLYGYYNRQMADFMRGINDPSVNDRVRRIWMQLAEKTGRRYPVLPAQQFTLGQALPNGVILLDISVAGNESVDVTAFWLAHEWAHQVLGHPLNALHPWGQYVMAMSGTAAEDSADQWAARFIRDKGYDLEPVVEFLRGLPYTGPGAHSPGPVRARIVADAFNGRQSSTGGVHPSISYVMERCVHRLHPSGDVGPCVHGRMHQADMFPCVHVMATPFGPRAMHPYDPGPCGHPVHPGGDVSPCLHIMHPEGDRREVRR